MTTRYGTYAYFRASTGNSNFINGNSYGLIDPLNYAMNKFYNPILADGETPALMSNDPQSLVKTQPDVATRLWWIWQLQQMVEAGLDFLVLDTLGMNTSQPVCTSLINNQPNRSLFQPDYAAKALSNVLGISASDNSLIVGKLKVGLMVEGGPAQRAYNWDLLLSKISACPNPFSMAFKPMPITVANGMKYYYDLSIKPFYDNLDRSLWLTNVAGRPIIFVYAVNENIVSGFALASAMWQAISAQFLADYGISPFLIFSKHWFDYGAGSELVALAGGMYEFISQWVNAKSLPSPGSVSGTGVSNAWNLQYPNHWNLNGFTCASVCPGVNAPQGHWNGILDAYMGKRWAYVNGTLGPDASYFLKMEFYRALAGNPDLVLLGHMDDYSEGQQWSRMANYLKLEGSSEYLTSDYYIKIINHLITGGK